MKKSWYSITAKAADQPADLSVHADIGMWGVSAADFLRDLKAVNAPSINLTINSPGGSVFDALAMFNGLRGKKVPINVKVLGIAASAASVLAMVGDRVEMPDNTMMMIHKPLLGLYGNADELRENAELLDKVEARLQSVYMARWNGTEEELTQALRDETYLSAAECLERGLCDEVTASIEAKAAFDVENLPEAVRKLFEAAATPPVEPAPKVELPASLVALIAATAAEAGLTDYAAHFAADKSIVDAAGATAAIAQAREVQALCALAAMPDLAGGLIRARTPLPEARVKVTEALALADPQITSSQSAETVNAPAPGNRGFDPYAIKREIEAQRSTK